MISTVLFLECLPHKHVLLVQRIAFAQGLGKGGEEVGELIVGLDVGGILLHRVLHLQNSGVFARLGIEHADAIHFLDGEVDVLEDALALPPVPNALTLMAMPTQMAENMSMMYRVIVLFFLIAKKAGAPSCVMPPPPFTYNH